MTAVGTPVDPATVERYVLELARHGQSGETGVSRTLYTPAWVAAQDLVARWIADAGLVPRRDAAGNVWGRIEGTEGGPAIVTGSHVDSQVPGGRYDGALGVVAGVLALRALVERHGRPRRPIEVLSLCEEEESRFQARWWGSRAIIGAVDPAEADAIADAGGVTIGEAMRAVGLDPARIAGARRDDVDTFLELHIEQGPVLEEAGVPVGAVRAITGLRHTQVELHGRADHAGARPMRGRRDPMAGAAEIVSGVIEEAERMGPPAVTTVGRLDVDPNLTAAVPERVTLTIDARHPDPGPLAELHARHAALVRAVAERRDLEARSTVLFEQPPCPCDPELVALLERAASDLGVPALTMHSGGGHDSQQLAGIARMAMLFVRSAGGRSHTPEEYTAPEDAARGVEVLAETVRRLAY